jgi:hypothetical protein
MNADKILLANSLSERLLFTRRVKDFPLGTSSASALICVYLRFNCRFSD